MEIDCLSCFGKIKKHPFIFTDYAIINTEQEMTKNVKK